MSVFRQPSFRLKEWMERRFGLMDWVGCVAVGWLLSSGIAWGACSLNVVNADTPSGVQGIRLVASTGPDAVPVGHLRIYFSGHSSFYLETPEGARIFTDYNARNLPPVMPEIITMSNPHPTHSVQVIDPGPAKILRGWNPKGGSAKIDLKHKDARIFNIPTNRTEVNGKSYFLNSIFVVEASRLCVAHLGNLNHLLAPEDAGKLGRVDVLFVPIGTIGALSPADAVAVIRQIRAPLVIPMHFDTTNPSVFVALARESFPVKVLNGNHMLVSRESLPKTTEIVFMLVKSIPEEK